MLDRHCCGEFGGAYIPQVLTSTFGQLGMTFQDAKNDPAFWQEFIQKKAEEYRA
jgi:tryptophan synthase beta chain